MMDIKRIRERFNSQRFSLMILKKDMILLESKSPGLLGLIRAIEKLGSEMQGTIVIDKIVGRAASLLLASCHVKMVYADVLSFEGMKVLNENEIIVEYDILVSNILDKEGKDICPFEKFSSNIRRPEEAYNEIKSFVKRYRN